MKSLGLFSQIIMVGLALVIGYFYVQPTLTEIGDVQTETAQYETERKKIEAINDQLAIHLATLDSISPSDKARLTTYMPRVVDDINVMRDISFMAERVNVTLAALSYDGPLDNQNDLFSQGSESGSSFENQPATPHSFTVDVQGSYDEIKDFLRLLELNEYPLEVYALSLSSNSADVVDGNGSAQMTATMTLVTYVDGLVLVNGN